MKELKREWQYQFTAERWGRFIHTRLWLGLPVAAAIGFSVIVLLGLWAAIARDILLLTAGKEALICAVAALFGILIATASTPEAVREKILKEEAEAMAMYQSTSRGRALFWVVVSVLILIALILGPTLLTEEWGSWEDPEGVIRITGGVLAGVTMVGMQLIHEVIERKNISR